MELGFDNDGNEEGESCGSTVTDRTAQSAPFRPVDAQPSRRYFLSTSFLRNEISALSALGTCLRLV
jgi:hypothetical protein